MIRFHVVSVVFGLSMIDNATANNSSVTLNLTAQNFDEELKNKTLLVMFYKERWVNLV